jgi:hypothetical protein
MAKPQGRHPHQSARTAPGWPASCHQGYDAEADMDNWSVAGVVFRPGLDMLKADEMPARTSIDFAVQRAPDDEPFWRQR